MTTSCDLTKCAGSAFVHREGDGPHAQLRAATIGKIMEALRRNLHEKYGDEYRTLRILKLNNDGEEAIWAGLREYLHLQDPLFYQVRSEQATATSPTILVLYSYNTMLRKYEPCEIADRSHFTRDAATMDRLYFPSHANFKSLITELLNEPDEEKVRGIKHAIEVLIEEYCAPKHIEHCKNLYRTILKFARRTMASYMPRCNTGCAILNVNPRSYKPKASNARISSTSKQRSPRIRCDACAVKKHV